jgi:hypothetical protein
MKRSTLALMLVAALAGGACGGGSSIPIPEPRPAAEQLRSDVDRILALLDVEGLLAPRARGFTRQVAIMVGDPTDEELERLVDAAFEGFAYDSLYRQVADFMVAEGTAELAGSALEWLEGGATAAVSRIGEEYDPPQSLQEYATEMTEDPPSEARIQLISTWAEARGEGSFFVLIQEALREAAFRAHRALREDAPAFEPLSGEGLELAEVNSHGAAVIRLMHGYAPAPDQLIRRATVEYQSEPGQWLVETYALAVASAIRVAGERAAARLRGDGAA